MRQSILTYNVRNVECKKDTPDHAATIESEIVELEYSTKKMEERIYAAQKMSICVTV